MKSKGNYKKELGSKVDKIDRKSSSSPKKDRSSKRKLSIYDEYEDENLDDYKYDNEEDFNDFYDD